MKELVSRKFRAGLCWSASEKRIVFDIPTAPLAQAHRQHRLALRDHCNRRRHARKIILGPVAKNNFFQLASAAGMLAWFLLLYSVNMTDVTDNERIANLPVANAKVLDPHNACTIDRFCPVQTHRDHLSTDSAEVEWDG